MSSIYEHGLWLEENTNLTKDEQEVVLSIVNDAVTTGIKLAQSLEYKSVKDNYTKSWDLIDAKKLRLVKRLARFKEGDDEA